MKQYPFLTTKWGKSVFALFLTAMLLLARDTLITSCLVGFTKSQFAMLGIICLMGLAFLLKNRKRWKEILLDPRVGIMVVCTLIPLLLMVSKRDWQLMYFSILLCLLFAVFLTCFTDWRRVAKYYVCILAGLSLYSLVAMYLFKPLALNGTIHPQTFVNSEGMEFYHFGLAYVVPWEFWYRNFGIFREPGVYQFFLILGLYLNHYGANWEKPWQRWLISGILAVTMVSTFAIGGFVEIGAFGVFLYFDRNWYKTKPGKLLGLGAVVALVTVIIHIIVRINTPYFELTIYYEFYDMFRRLTTDSDSLVDRFSAIFTSAELFLQHPLLGSTISQVLHGTAHNTSSTLILFATLGVAGGAVHVASWIALLWRKERCILGNLMLLGILLLSFNTQNLVADVFFWLFPMMALTEKLLTRWNLPKGD